MTSDKQARAEAVQDAIADANIRAFQEDDAMMIWVCMAPCVSPPMGCLNCPLCELIIVMPNGTVSRETRRH